MPLIGAKGIWKPAVLDLPMSIITAAPRIGVEAPYPDEISPGGQLLYRYEGTNPNLWTNVGLRAAMDLGVPVLYLRGIVKGLYSAEGALIISDDPPNLTFTVFTAPLESVSAGMAVDLDSASRRHYLRQVKQRIDQQAFRRAVLTAYRTRCSVCHLGHAELLDAAHIVPYGDGGETVVPNGLSMCKIHHAAFDANIMGVRPDLVSRFATTSSRKWMAPCFGTASKTCTASGSLFRDRIDFIRLGRTSKVRYSRFLSA